MSNVWFCTAGAWETGIWAYALDDVAMYGRIGSEHARRRV